jgi:hypothetical protein
MSQPAITGEFEYVKDESIRIMLVNAYLGILWQKVEPL